MQFIVSAVISIFMLFGTIATQATSNIPAPTACQSDDPYKYLSACNSFNSTLYKCNATTTTQNEYRACICTQDFLNSIVDCESEQRLCFQNTNYDSSAQRLVGNWHSQCDAYISYKPTTPALSSLTRTLNGDACTTAFSSCASFSYEYGLCSSTFPAANQISQQMSCACQTKLLSLGYECGFVGNVSCQGVEGTMSDVWGYSFCTGFAAYFVTATKTSLPNVITQVTSGPSGGLTSLTSKPTINGPTGTATTTSSSNSVGVSVLEYAISTFRLVASVCLSTSLLTLL